MNAGDLKYRIEIWKPSVLTTDYGNLKVVYEKSYTCRCAVRHDASSKTEDLNEVVYKQYKQIQVYSYVDVEEDDRILLLGKFYSITSIDEDPERNRKIIIITQVKN